MENECNIYHEKQSRELCALHALNNLFQQPHTFTKQDMDSICQNLAPRALINPHCSIIGLGNYDVNVIISALQLKDMDTVWFDKRKDINQLVLENIFGFILNIPADFTIGRIHLPLHRKHWIAVRQIGSIFYNLDSKLDAPEAIGAEGALRKFLTEQVESKEKQMLLVVNPAVAHSGAWINSGEKSTPTDAKDEKNDLSESMSGHGGS